jgi:SpoVK/Ycf46/Vps4 family AAA+-type ATPase
MKNLVILNGNDYRLMYGNELAVYEKLPPNIYEVKFDKEKGYYLTNIGDTYNITHKLYGDIETITNRVMISFEQKGTNLGVLFSGPKGLGKSLTIKNICKASIAKGYPVILIRDHFNNLSTFIDTICQTCVIVIDEFEKLYPDQEKTKCEELEGQDNLLNMFDSTLSHKKLFLLTCNDLRNLSEYLLNRPGRIHYHFRLNRISVDDIREYCNDNLRKELKEEEFNYIEDICSLGTRVPDFSYDMLNAIIYELNTFVCDLKEVKEMLNLNASYRAAFNFMVHYESGKVQEGFDFINLSSERWDLYWYPRNKGERNLATVDMTKAIWNRTDDSSLVLTKEFVHHVYIAPQNEDEGVHDSIEKIIFTPAKKGFLSQSSYYD